MAALLDFLFSQWHCSGGVQKARRRGRSAGVVPWHEVFDAAVGPAVGEALECACEPGAGVDRVHLGGLHQGGDRRPGASAAFGAGEERILPDDGLEPDGALDDIGADFDAAVAEVTLENGAAGGGATDRLRQLGSAGDPGQFRFPADVRPTSGQWCESVGDWFVEIAQEEVNAEDASGLRHCLQKFCTAVPELWRYAAKADAALAAVAQAA